MGAEAADAHVGGVRGYPLATQAAEDGAGGLRWEEHAGGGEIRRCRRHFWLFSAAAEAAARVLFWEGEGKRGIRVLAERRRGRTFSTAADED